MKLTNSRKEEILEGFQKKTVVVIGDIMIDEYMSGIVERISPEAPVPIIEIDKEVMRFGGAANVAFNLQKLGVSARLIGVTGDDRMGKNLVGLMQENNMVTEFIVNSNERPTTVKTRIIGDNQHIARVDREVKEPITKHEESIIIEKIEQALLGASAVILEDYNKGVMTENVIRFAIAQCQKKNIPITVDPKFTNFLQYTGVTVFKPNELEIQKAMAVQFNSEEDVHRNGQKLLNDMALESLLLTRGAKGLSLFQNGKPVMHIPTLARKVADVSGAGDTVIATLTAGIIGGATKAEAAYLANIAAGLVVEEVGVVPIEYNMLKQYECENE